MQCYKYDYYIRFSINQLKTYFSANKTFYRIFLLKANLDCPSGYSSVPVVYSISVCLFIYTLIRFFFLINIFPGRSYTQWKWNPSTLSSSFAAPPHPPQPFPSVFWGNVAKWRKFLIKFVHFAQCHRGVRHLPPRRSQLSAFKEAVILKTIHGIFFDLGLLKCFSLYCLNLQLLTSIWCMRSWACHVILNLYSC